MTLLLLLATTGWASEPEQSAIGRAANWFLSHKPSLSREDCSGLVSDILNRAGQRVYGTVTTIVDWSREQGWFHLRHEAKVGDIVFFDRTYDSNRNGRVDDLFTHIAVVTAVDPDGTIHMVHNSSSQGIAPLRMNLQMPDTYRVGERVVNDYLVRKSYAGEGGLRLTGQVWSGFASPTHRAPSPARAAAPSPPPPPEVHADTPPEVAYQREEPPRTRRERARKRRTPSGIGDPYPARPPARLVARVLFGAPLKKGDLRAASCDDLWWLRNAVYARHGYAFESERARAAFGPEPWYVRDQTVHRTTVGPLLREADSDNVTEIVSEETDRCN